MRTVNGSLLAAPDELEVPPSDDLATYADALAKAGATNAFNAHRSLHRTWELTGEGVHPHPSATPPQRS